MRTAQFIREYLKPEARIQICSASGVWYEGDVMSLPMSIIFDTKIIGVCLVGGLVGISIAVE